MGISVGLNMKKGVLQVRRRKVTCASPLPEAHVVSVPNAGLSTSCRQVVMIIGLRIQCETRCCAVCGTKILQVKKQEVCRLYLRGECGYGSACKRLHPKSGQEKEKTVALTYYETNPRRRSRSNSRGRSSDRNKRRSKSRSRSVKAMFTSSRSRSAARNANMTPLGQGRDRSRSRSRSNGRSTARKQAKKKQAQKVMMSKIEDIWNGFSEEYHNK